MKKLILLLFIFLLTGCQQQLGATFDKKVKATKLYERFTIENNSLKKEVKDIKVVIGDKDSSIFIPEVTTTKWDEVGFKISVPKKLGSLGASSDIVISDNNIVYKEADTETVITDLPIDSINENGGYSFDTILKKKPLTNVIEYIIESNGLDFLYQTPPTQQEIDDGLNMPENIIGSYAVYTSEDKNNVVGGKEYKTGKVAHIYRPKIIDANGLEVWGEMNISSGVLSITIPKKFLDDASYPVLVDPTFGYTTLGGSTQNFLTNEGRFKGLNDIADGGTLTSVSAACYSASNYNAKGAVYESSSDPRVRHTICAALALTSSTNTWNTAACSNEAIAAGTYSAGYIFENTGTCYRDTGGPTGSSWYNTNNYASPAETVTSPLQTITKYSMYATYESGSSSANIKSINKVNYGAVKSVNGKPYTNIIKINNVNK